MGRSRAASRTDRLQGGIKWFKENIEKAAIEITMKIVLSWRYVKGTATFLVGKSSTSVIQRSIILRLRLFYKNNQYSLNQTPEAVSAASRNGNYLRT
jgi:hypothetical protein